ncbi:TonB-dependent siderophore receptor [Comamonas composti]|uniref:TonB-dependent siderophore receptor n=1 Tax=Comamonas composti TaxID=408558 RepID=UPI000479E781
MSSPFPQPCLPARHPMAAAVSSVALALLAWHAPLPALAQSAAATDMAAAVDFHIAAQPLGQALTQLARQAGLQLLVAPELVQERRAPAVEGRFTTAVAVDRLLRGSGLEGHVSQSTLVVDKPAGTSALPEVTVSAVGETTTTEGSGSYTTGLMSTSTKLPLSIRETPQSLTVVTRQKMDDQGMLSIDDVANSTTGVTLNRISDDRSSYYARGFAIGSFLQDGVPISYEADTSTYDTMAMYDHVEVVRGPTGLMTGVGDPSGTINFVRKRAPRETQRSLTLRGGSWNQAVGELDLGGALNADGSARGRVVASLQSRDHFTDGYSSKRQLLYGTAELDLGRDTTLSVGGSYVNEDNPGSQWMGVPRAFDGSPLPISRSQRFSPSWSKWDKKEVSLFADLEHRFDSGWKARLAARALQATSALDGAYLVYGGIDHQGRTLYDVAGGPYDYDKKQLSLDASAQGPVRLFGREHDLAFGISRRTIRWNDLGYSYLSPHGDWLIAEGVDPLTWNPDSLDRSSLLAEDLWTRRQKTTLTSAYATGRFLLAAPLSLIAGARLDWYDFSNAQRQGSWSKDRAFKESAHVTPYAALTYDLNDSHSVYASYTSIFRPQDYLDVSGSMLPPVEGRNFELGLKGSYLHERVNLAMAVFNTTQDNLPQAIADIASCTVATNCYRSVGKVKSRGVDVDINGEILPRLNAGLGYTYTQAKIAGDSTDGDHGAPYASHTPRHQLKLSAMYHLGGDLDAWRVGGGLRYQSRTTSESTTRAEGYVMRQSAYAVADLVVGYRVSRQLDLQLNISNLFDKHYYQTLGTNNGANYFGTPRRLLLSAKYQF